jgi:DNA-binding XRE family transcriptional regulator
LDERRDYELSVIGDDLMVDVIGFSKNIHDDLKNIVDSQTSITEDELLRLLGVTINIPILQLRKAMNEFQNGKSQMFVITDDLAKEVRYKRADLMLNKTQAAKMMNVSRLIYQRIETGGYIVRKTTYKKICNWLDKDY